MKKQWNEVSIIPDFSCNGSCHHCSLKNFPCFPNRERFLKNLPNFLKSFDSSNSIVYIFRGEPLLVDLNYLFTIKEILDKNSFKFTLSSNLLVPLNDKHLEFLKSCYCYINTSFNYSRFKTDKHFELFKLNCKKLELSKISYEIMTTLDFDLIKVSPQDFIQNLKGLKPQAVIFERLVGFSLDNSFVEIWLENFYQYLIKHPQEQFTRFEPFSTLYRTQNQDKLEKHCFYKKALFPDGEIKPFCPYGQFKNGFPFCYENSVCNYCNISGLPENFKKRVLQWN